MVEEQKKGPGRPKGYNLSLDEEKQMREFFTQMRDKSQAKREYLKTVPNNQGESKKAVLEMFDMFELLP